VPFDSGAESVSAVLGGHTDLMYEEYGPSRALIEAGRLRPLVVFSEERLPVLPDVPTAREAGIDVTLGRWRGFALKEGDDKAHAGALFSIFQKASQDPRYKATEEKSGLQYRSVLLGPDEFKAFLDSEIETYRAVLKSLGHI
jgi:putative tricarboxylic transport membrane protein